MNVVVPYVAYEDLRRVAERFLTQYHHSRAIPVPIEAIVEFQLDIDIVPIPGLHVSFDIDSMISKDLQRITVDQMVFEERPGRYRFSLAHEVGHRVMHADVFAQLDFETTIEWKEAISRGISEKEYSKLEFQAYAFAGLLLVPGRELEERFGAAVRLAESQGLTLNAESDATREMIAGYLSREFVVSRAVIEKRLGYDHLWQ